MNITATDAPNLSNVTDLRGMFEGATQFNGSIGHWDVSHVTNLNNTFYEASAFNQDINSWHVSSVTSMANTFGSATSFNQNLSSWEVFNVTNMYYMFSRASSFNKFLSTWDVSSVTSMEGMFSGAKSFNQNISAWEVDNVVNMRYMFEDAESFNQDISSWNVSNVTIMEATFLDAKTFNQNISSWDVSKVTTMEIMFAGCAAFNQPIGSWNVSNVTNMRAIFSGNKVFNQDLSGWNVGKVKHFSYAFYAAPLFNGNITNWDMSSATDLSYMFREAYSFNQDIGGWNVSNVKNLAGVFQSARSFNHDISTWNVANVTNAALAFNGATLFNQEIGNWNVSNVTQMQSMFASASAFNGDLSGWNVSAVTNMSKMFSYARSFSQDITGWDVSGVTDMNSMFYSHDNFNQNIGTWDVGAVKDFSSMFSYAKAFKQDLTNWDISSATKMADMFGNSGYTTLQYDLLIKGWAAKADLNTGVTFGASNLGFCDAVEEHQSLIDDFGWVIDDRGRICEPTDIVLSSYLIDENNVKDKAIAAISTVDKEDGEEHTYDILYLSDHWLFSIKGDSLVAGVQFNYESTDSYQFSIRSTDSHNLSVIKEIRIDINDVNDPPKPFIQMAISDKITGFEEILVSLKDSFRDEDGDELSYTVVAESDTIVEAHVVGTNLSLKGIGMGTTNILLTANDGRGGTAEMTFSVKVNIAPTVITPLSDISEFFSANVKTLSLASVFSDVDGTYLVFSATSSDESVATVGTAGSNPTLNITPKGIGSTMITVFADDGRGGIAKTSFNYTVKPTVILVNPLGDMLLQQGFDAKLVEIASIFDFKDIVPSYSAITRDSLVATVDITEGLLKITEVFPGQTTITVSGEDGLGNSVPNSFILTINGTPIVSNSFVDQVVYEGFTSTTIDVSDKFSDPDGNQLTYQVTSSNEAVVSVHVETSVITFIEVGKGSSTIGVIADDGTGGTVASEFEFEVKDARLLAVKGSIVDGSLTMFPNPASKTLILKGSSVNDKAVISIVDLSGRSHQVDVIYKDGEIQLDVSELSKGVYVLMLDLDGRLLAKKFIKD